MRKINKRNVVILILVIIIVGFNHFKKANDKKFIINDYLITTGIIIDYSIIGDTNSHYITYEYFIKERRYERTIYYPSRNLEFIYDNIEKYSNWHFLVLCSKKDNSKSIIDFSKRIERIPSHQDIIDFSSFK
nr:hypothetical protein [uncultured Carboxylicivirga sp.]